MQRRDFITLLGGAAAAGAVRPLPVRAQQPAMPVIGLLNGVSNDSYAARIDAIREGLKEQGFVEGRNLAIEYRAADGQYDRLPALAAELVRLQVAAIVAIGGTNAPRAAKAATSTIPIVFMVGSDAVETGLVTSLSRPEANITGVSANNSELSPKRLEMMHELVPNVLRIGFLLNPGSPAFNTDTRDIPAAAQKIGREIVIQQAGTAQDIEAAFAAMLQQRVAALIVQNDAFLNSRRDQIIRLAARHALPAIYGAREYVLAGGLISYAPKIDDSYRQAGIYAGRILKGEKPADLPVVQPTRFELMINLKTARTLGITVPLTLQVAADEVIE